MTSASAAHPLDGILVVSLEQAVAAPYCTSRLADAGARVIKVERAGGDFARRYDRFAGGHSSYFVWLNRGKQSLVADIKDPQDRALLYRIVDRADVFVQNLAPGAAARAGFGSAALRRRNPRLITVDISGYGADGAYADMKAYDLLVQAESGLAAITGGVESPGRVGVSVCDIACGMYSVASVLEALLARGVTGRGCAIETSLFAGMADWMTVPLLHWESDGSGPRRVGLNHPSIHPYGAYPTRDGPPVLIAVQNEREFVRLCAEVLERPELPEDPRFESNVARLGNAAAFDEILIAGFRARPRPALLARLRAAKIAYGEVNGIEGLARHPALRRMAVAVDDGAVSLVAPPARIDGETRSPGPVPQAGADSVAIRAEFGA